MIAIRETAITSPVIESSNPAGVAISSVLRLRSCVMSKQEIAAHIARIDRQRAAAGDAALEGREDPRAASD
jgi:hypothetical protein